MRDPILRSHTLWAAVAGATFACVAPAAQAQWQIQPTDGSSIKFGFLMQGQAESVDVNADDTAQNLFFRRNATQFQWFNYFCSQQPGCPSPVGPDGPFESRSLPIIPSLGLEVRW